MSRVPSASGLPSHFPPLARQVLESLQGLTGLESLYLSRIRWSESEEEVVFARNGLGLEIREGLIIPWGDSLCRGVLMGAPSYTDDVPVVFPGNPMAKQLELRTFFCYPVMTADHEIFGTLCGASRSRSQVDEPALRVTQLLARLLSDQLDGALPPPAPAGPPVAAVQDFPEALRRDLEHVARLVIESLKELTGLDSVYLTQLGEPAGEQEVLFSRNGKGLVVQEGVRLGPSELLYRWELAGAPCHTVDAPAMFPESRLARQLGLRTTVSCPVRTADRDSFGMLCGVSVFVCSIDDGKLRVFQLFARLISEQVDRHRELARQRARAESAELLAGSDPLTGVTNRRTFEARWRQELARAVRHDYPLSLIMLDVDRFKAINDAHGHPVGDAILRRVAQVMTLSVRGSDMVARLGGDEFAIVLPFTDREGAVRVAERVRTSLQVKESGDPLQPCTVSAGLACSRSTPGAQLVEAADRALYRAKSKGRDLIDVWEGPLTQPTA